MLMILESQNYAVLLSANLPSSTLLYLPLGTSVVVFALFFGLSFSFSFSPSLSILDICKFAFCCYWICMTYYNIQKKEADTTTTATMEMTTICSHLSHVFHLISVVYFISIGFCFSFGATFAHQNSNLHMEGGRLRCQGWATMWRPLAMRTRAGVYRVYS